MEIQRKYSVFEPQIPYSIQRISIGEELCIIGMAGEVCAEYGLMIKEMLKRKYVVTAAYCNGTVGYIPTAKMFDEGGYEPGTSWIYYCYPAPFHRDLESIIKQSLGSILYL